MLINVKAKPSPGENKVEKVDDGNFVVAVKEPPVQGRANAAITKVLARYFGIPASGIKIILGFTSKQKVLEIK